MEHTKPLYLMISRTNTGMGKLIRTFCRYPYNHISMTLEDSFQNWYSFARYSQDVPLYGGFIRETAERLLASGKEVPVRIFRVEIPADQAQSLQELFSQAGKRDYGLVYNTFDAVASSVGRSIPISNAYTCVSFACAVLGLPLRSIRELDDHLTPWLIYEGSLSQLISDSGSREDDYFRNLGFLRGSRNTAKHFYTLCRRIHRPHKEDLITRYTISQVSDFQHLP